MLDVLKKKIAAKRAKVGIIGLGYVGLPLAVTFAMKGFKVYGIDIDKDRVERLNRGESYILDVSASDIAKARRSGALAVTTDFSVVKDLDAVIICVPTPLHKSKEPDVSYIVSAVESIKRHMKRGQIIVLESTTYPGTTEEVMLPVLEAGGLKEGRDFYLAFSPERIDPGNTRYHTANTPKIIGGISRRSTEAAKILYEQVIEKVLAVSSAKVAEMSKLLENTFRIVNIGLVNEIMLMCDKLGIDVWEVIEAAKTKPYGFMPFYPGPGVGGHCLSKDEYVFVKDKGASALRTVKISDLVREMASSPDSTIHNLKKAVFIRPDSKEALSYDPINHGPCFREIRLLSERPYNGRMVNVRTRDNRVFSVTEKHPVLVSANGILGVKFAEELAVGDEVPVMMKLPDEKTDPGNLKIDIIDFLSANNLIDGIRVTGDGFRWSDYRDLLRRRAAKEEMPRLRDYLRSEAIPLRLYLVLEKEADWPFGREDLLLAAGRGPSLQTIPAVIDIDEDFLRFIGYYLSEGCITEDGSLRVRLSFHRDETQYMNDAALFLSGKGIRYSIYRSRKRRSAAIKISSNVFGLLLRDILACGVGSYTMKIPERFLLLPRKLKIHLLMGILRGDGGVDHVNRHRVCRKKGRVCNHRNNSCTVNYFSSSGVLFNQVILLLQDFGLMPAFKKRRALMTISGYEQLKALKGLFLGEKRSRPASCLTDSRKIIPNRTFNSHRDFYTTGIKDITYSTGGRVYSMEVRDTNTFVTSYGILTHNCIPIDPIYLSWKARGHGFEARFIDLASYVNSQMPHYVVSKVIDGLNRHKKSLKAAKVLLIGIAYKKDVKDLRESPALEIIHILKEKGAAVSYYDPYLPYLKWNSIDLKSVRFNRQSLKAADCVIIVTDHSDIDYGFIAKSSKLIIDTRNALKGIRDRSNIARL